MDKPREVIPSPESNRGGAAGAAGHSVAFDEARPDWLELWQGPIYFRATYDKGKYGLGHTLERINQYGREGATGGGRHEPIYSVRLDPATTSEVHRVARRLPGRQPPYQCGAVL